MRTFTKKRGFFVVAAALLIVTAMLGITWCSNGAGNIGYTDDFTPPQGKGAVRLSFDKTIGRTILPGDTITVSTFAEFDFAFTATSGGTSYTEFGIEYANLSDPIVLDPGTYSLKVIAYIKDSSNVMQPAAISDPVTVLIVAAKTTSEQIVLKPYGQTTGTGNGTFKYEITGDIDEDEDIISAVMNLTPILAGTLQSNIDIADEFNDGDEHELPVKAGDYYLDVVVEVASGDTVTFRHIVHIYQNMVSSYVFIIDRDYFNAVFELVDGDLTYEGPDDNLPSLTAAGTPVAEGDTVEVDLGDTVTIAVTNGTLLGFTGYEWWFGTTSLQTGASSTYIVDTSDPPFDEKKTYMLTVVGVIGTKKYYTFINIKVVQPAP